MAHETNFLQTFLDNFFTVTNIGTIALGLIVSYFLVKRVNELKGANHPHAHLGWIPFYNNLLLSKVATGSYKLGAILLIGSISATTLLAIAGVGSLTALATAGADILVAAGIFLVLSLVLSLVLFVVQLILNKKVVEAFGYSWGAAILVTIFAPISWAILLIVAKDKKDKTRNYI